MGLQYSRGHVTYKKLLFFYSNPPWGFHSLHMDGATKNDIASGGGLLKDHNGPNTANFFAFYSSCTNNLAESRTLLDGLKNQYKVKLCNGGQFGV